MSAGRMRVEAPCPACGKRELDYSSTNLDIPYFPDATQLLFDCASCGFRHADFLIGNVREATRFTYDVRREEDLSVRVVRSTSGTVRIPELGVLIEPGPASDAYVSNIEGVLDRVQGVLEQLLRDAESGDQRKACEDRLGDVRKAREGTFPFTFVLEDPLGNSAVIHEAARVELMDAAEAAGLKSGAYTIELQESVPDDPSGNGRGRSNGGVPPA